jgi:long-chain acyl-CoA synthetase
VVIAFFGALRAEAIVTQLNPLYSKSETAHQLKDSGSQYVVSLDRFVPILDPLLEECGIKKVWLTRINDYFSIPLKWFYPIRALMQKSWMSWPSKPIYKSFVKELDSASDQAVVCSLKMEDTAILQYTGGTTGVAKGVILTHRNLVANAFQCKLWFPGMPDGSEVFLIAIPIFHCYGLTAGMNFALCKAALMVLLPKFDVVQSLEAIQKHKVTVFPGVQAIYNAINHHPRVGKYNLRSIKACLSGAGPQHLEVQKKFEELTGGRVSEGYGLTEASPVTHCNPIFGKRKVGFIGVPFPGTDCKIVDLETGKNVLGIGEIGEIAIQGPQVMQGYWNHPVETSNVLKDGWLYTGDIGYMDPDGFFAVVDRKKDMVKVGGENVYPREVEEVLFQNPKVLDCVVAGVPDDKFVDRLKAYVVLKPGSTATSEEILDFCRGKLAKFKLPKEVAFKESLPKNMVGKMLRRLLVEEEKEKHKK